MKIKMSDQALAKQKPKDDRYEVWDTLVSNLMVTVFQVGRKLGPLGIGLTASVR